MRKKESLLPNMIVGIGASAGGLESLQEFFKKLSSPSSFAIVIIQHLSPNYESLMAELLRRNTNIPITTVSETTPLQKNNIYLLPPNKQLILNENNLELLDRPNKLFPHLPIDLFFESLSKHAGESAVAIILSGTGTDGSRGIRKVKDEGGLVMIQSPKSAKFDGMPKAALFLGIEDLVMTPAELAIEIDRISKRITCNGPKELRNKAKINSFLELMNKRRGVDFSVYRRKILMRRLKKRLVITNTGSLDDYLETLRSNEEEIDKLFSDFLIGVTHFFRDEEAFSIIYRDVIPQLFNNIAPDKELRIWVAGCSTGEEAYTLAILLEEYKEQNEIRTPYRIFATDLNEKSISFASKGIYPKNLTQNIKPAYLEKYFIPTFDKFQVKERIQKNIVFTIHDVASDPPFIKIDMITCRNLLIYIEPMAQQRILNCFQFCLMYHGFLFLGPSETIGSLEKSFDRVSSKWNIFKNQQKEKVVLDTFPNNSNLSNSGKRNRMNLQAQPASYQDLSHQEEIESYSEILAREFAPICMIVEKNLDVKYSNGEIDLLFYFPKASRKLNLKEMMNKEESLIFRNAIRKLEESSEKLIYKNIQFNKREKLYLIDLHFKHVTNYSNAPFILIEIYIKGEAKFESGIEIDSEKFKEERLETLEFELREAKSETQALIKQLQTTNQEIQVSNEELLASNEELQSTNEELQSVNEELYTVNAELQTKINELTIVNNDIDNLLKSTQIGTIFLDADLRIRKFTPNISEQFDVLDADIGRPINNFSNKFDDQDIFEELSTVLQDLKIIEKEIKTHKGKSFLMRILPYQTSDKHMEGVVVTFVDIEEIVQVRQEILNFNVALEQKVKERTLELRSTNEELAMANSYLDSFVYATAHDLRAPFLNIKSFADLYEKVESVEEKNEIIDKMKIAINRLGKTLNGLVHMIEFHKNKERLVEEVQFENLFNEATENLSKEIKTIQPDLKLDFQVKSIPYVKALLLSTFENLLSNSIKYRHPDRKLSIEIKTSTSDNFVELTFSDNGIGIDMEKYGSKIFEPFKRFTNQSEGVGIGLSLVNQAVNLNGGKIKVSSKPDLGATFIILLRRYD